jgi:glycosyltransferase involved in cell wall biosynthesis
MNTTLLSAPRISVLLPVYNGAPYLQAAIDSVLQQSYSDFELIVINDGSTDETAEILDRITDSRVRVIHQTNHGLALTLNRAVKEALGEYLVRQDADDLCLPQRFERQIAFLDAHPEHALVGSWTRILEIEAETARGHRHPTENGELQFLLLFDSYFVHSSVMMRSAALREVGAYPTDPERNPPEDFDLWSRIARRYQVANIDDVLQLYRELPGSISRSKAELLKVRAVRIAVENLTYITANQVAPRVIQDLAALVHRSESMISAQPNWCAIDQALVVTRKRLIARFPQQAPQICQGEKAIRLSLKAARLRGSWLVPWLRRLYRLIKH